jgi:hypothetical protein
MTRWVGLVALVQMGHIWLGRPKMKGTRKKHKGEIGHGGDGLAGWTGLLRLIWIVLDLFYVSFI